MITAPILGKIKDRGTDPKLDRHPGHSKEARGNLHFLFVYYGKINRVCLQKNEKKRIFLWNQSS